MRVIKFRGKTYGGGLVYGDLTQAAGMYFVNDYRVEPESIAQLCGYDVNEEEVYEGDEVEAHGKVYKVEMKARYGLFTELKRSERKKNT